MSQHPSLKSSDKGKQHRSVLKRHERLKILQEKEKWDDKDSVFGLPKVKVVRFKIKKEKAKAEEAAEAAPGAAGTEGAAPAAAPAKAAAAGKAAAPAKAAASGKAGVKDAKPQQETKK